MEGTASFLAGLQSSEWTLDWQVGFQYFPRPGIGIDQCQGNNFNGEADDGRL